MAAFCIIIGLAMLSAAEYMMYRANYASADSPLAFLLIIGGVVAASGFLQVLKNKANKPAKKPDPQSEGITHPG